MFLILTKCRNKETINIHLSYHKNLMKKRGLWEVKIRKFAASHQHALVQVHFSCLDQAGKTNQTELQKRRYHTNVHWCRVISPAWTRRRKTNLKSSVGKEIAGKGNLSTSHNGSAFTQTGMHVLKIKSHLTM